MPTPSRLRDPQLKVIRYRTYDRGLDPLGPAPRACHPAPADTRRREYTENAPWHRSRLGYDTAWRNVV
jgi:hypothetical protein